MIVSTAFLLNALLPGVPSQTKLPLWRLRQNAPVTQPRLRPRTRIENEGVFWGGGLSGMKLNTIILETEAYPLADEREALVKRARDWLSLPDGWNEEESKAPTPAAFDALKQLIEALPPDARLPKLMLADNGTLGMYWDLPACYIDIEFKDDGTFSLFKRDKASGIEEFDAGRTVSDGLHALLQAMNYNENFAFAA